MGNAIKKDVIHAEGIDIGIYTSDYENEFISLTDIAKKKEGEYPGYVIQNWMRNRSVISFIAIKDHLIPPELTPEQIGYKYANEADMLNVVLFGKTAKQWRDANPGKKGNIRDDANLNQLLVLANMESYNAILIGQGKTMSERIVLLRELAVKQMKTLSMVNMEGLKQLPGCDSE